MATATLSSKFQIVIPKEVRERLRLSPRQRFQIFDRGGLIVLVPEVPPHQLRGFLKGMDASGIREKKDRV
jgi:AbrB family looped-hinge helix DNA binding protein